MEEENFEKVEFMNSEQDLMNAMAADTGNEPVQSQPQVEQQVEQPQETPYVDPEAASVENQEVQESPEPQNTDQEEREISDTGLWPQVTGFFCPALNTITTFRTTRK